MNVKLLREDLQRRLRKHWTRVMDLFVQWDVNGDGYISQVEFIKGLLALGIPAEPQSVGMLFSELERGPGGQVSFTELNRAIRAPDVSEAEKRRRAGGPVTVVVPLTRESYAASKAEKAEKAERAAQEAREAREAGGEHAAGPLDAEVVGVPGGPRGVTIGSPTGAGNKRTVWEVMEGKLTPDGAAGAPAWQKEVMRKAKLQVGQTPTQVLPLPNFPPPLAPPPALCSPSRPASYALAHLFLSVPWPPSLPPFSAFSLSHSLAPRLLHPSTPPPLPHLPRWRSASSTSAAP
jgi:hypothetical protein